VWRGEEFKGFEGFKEFRSSGVQEFRSSGVQEFRIACTANCKKKRRL
jgi:hypothetical protein